MKNNELLKVTSLLYFKDALLKQEYEACQELLESARNFGAEQSEIEEVIVSYFRGGKTGGRSEANRIKAQLQTSKE